MCSCSLRKILYSASGDAPRRSPSAAGAGVAMVPRSEGFLTHMLNPETLPAWLTESDLDFYAEQFAQSGFRGGLNWYRNIDRNWEATGSVCRCVGDRPRALHRRRS